jgi:hypothetical protein
MNQSAKTTIFSYFRSKGLLEKGTGHKKCLQVAVYGLIAIENIQLQVPYPAFDPSPWAPLWPTEQEQSGAPLPKFCQLQRVPRNLLIALVLHGGEQASAKSCLQLTDRVGRKRHEQSARAGDIDPQAVNSPTETRNSLPPLFIFLLFQSTGASGEIIITATNIA